MSNVTWEQLTEAQRKYLATVCEADGWILSPFYDFIIPLNGRMALFHWGLLEQGGGGRKNNILERATAAGLEVYAQRHAVPASITTQVEYTIDSFEMADDMPDIRIENQTGYSIIATVNVADGEVVIILVKTEDALQPTEPLAAVWQSTAALYERFGLKPTVQNTSMVFSEETAELLHAALLESPDNTALEAADVIVTALGVCMARGVTLDAVVAAIRATVAKNDAKTHATHAVNAAGKIARRVE